MKEDIVTSVASGAWLLWYNRGIRVYEYRIEHCNQLYDAS